jgi:hypothetical protein
MSQMVKPPAYRWLVVLLLLGLLLLAISPPRGVFARPLNQSNRKPSTLCGRLVFLEDVKTGAKMIGLIPCNGSRPIIFAAGPAELYDYYRFTNVVIKKGDRVTTATYGTLENYITRFDSYKQIASCRECDSNAAGFQPASADQAGNCSAWVLDRASTAFPELNLAQDIETMQQNLQAYAGGDVATRQCGVDSACRIGAVAQQLGVQLGPRLNWGGVTTGQTIAWLAGLLADPATTEACPSIDVVAPSLAVGLNQQGYGIDLAAIQEGCNLLAVDDQDRRVGFEAGSAVEQAPEAKAVAAPLGQYLLLPYGGASQLNILCTNSDYVNLQLTQRDATGIHLYTFSRLPVQNSTRGEIDLSTSPLVMSLDARGDGNLQERKPDRNLLHPALVALIVPATPTVTPAPPTETPSASSTPVATPTPTATLEPPSPTPAQTEAPTPTPVPASGPAGLCPLAFGMALLPGVFWWRRKASTRRGVISS